MEKIKIDETLRFVIKCRNRWAEIEERLCDITKIQEELEGLHEDEETRQKLEEIGIQRTTAYLLLKQEYELLYKEQSLLEKALSL